MNSKQRMLIAMQGGEADRVPVCPDIGRMIPCRLSGKSCVDIYLHENPPLWKLYIETVKHFGIDGMMSEWEPGIKWRSRHGSKPSIRNKIETISSQRISKKVFCDFQAGSLSDCTLYFHDDEPSMTEKMIKDASRDLPIFMEWMDADIESIDWSGAKEQYEQFGDLGIWGSWVECPGPQMFLWWFNGGLEAVITAMYDRPDDFEEIRQIMHRRIMETTKRLLDAPVKLDYILIGASGLLTLSNPDIFQRFSMPTIKEVTSLCRQAGMPTMLHSCGKSQYLLESLATDTDLDCLNPLEIPPAGDVILAEAKKEFGGKIALMGNLHTTNTMLFGTKEDVIKASKQAIDDAAKGGGFILSTGDQVGRDTPYENIFAMVDVAKEYGKY